MSLSRLQDSAFEQSQESILPCTGMVTREYPSGLLEGMTEEQMTRVPMHVFTWRASVMHACKVESAVTVSPSCPEELDQTLQNRSKLQGTQDLETLESTSSLSSLCHCLFSTFAPLLASVRTIDTSGPRWSARGTVCKPEQTIGCTIFPSNHRFERGLRTSIQSSSVISSMHLHEFQ